MTNQELRDLTEAIRGRCFPLGSLIKSTKVAWEKLPDSIQGRLTRNYTTGVDKISINCSHNKCLNETWHMAELQAIIIHELSHVFNRTDNHGIYFWANMADATKELEKKNDPLDGQILLHLKVHKRGYKGMKKMEKLVTILLEKEKKGGKENVVSMSKM